MLHETRDVIIHIAHLNKDNTLVYYGSSAKLMLLNIICLNVICSVTIHYHRLSEISQLNCNSVLFQP